MKKDYIENVENAERRFFMSTVESRSSEDEGETIEGYAALYGSRTDLGMFHEEIRSGAFDGVLNDDVRALYNHDPNMVLARSVNGEGTLKLSLDAKGLRYSYKTPNRSYAKDLADAIRSGDVSQSSFAFQVESDEWKEGRSGEPDVRTITKFKKLFDVSPVTYPAYPDATVGARGLETIKQEKEAREKEKVEYKRKVEKLKQIQLKQKVK